MALGCPSLDRKVVNSGKRLRAYVGIDEGNVSNDLVSDIICFCLWYTLQVSFFSISKTDSLHLTNNYNLYEPMLQSGMQFLQFEGGL